MRSLVITILLGLGAPAWAAAGEDLASARDALKAKNAERVEKALVRAEEALPNHAEVVSSTLVGRYFYYRGMQLYQQSGSSDDTLDAWRQAFAVDLEVKWDDEISQDGTARDLFLALRTEVADRPQVSAQVPEATGAAQLYVDGVRVRAGDTVREGEHLAQIVCDDAKTYGTWTDFGKKMKWFKLCPGGVDTSVVVVEEEPEDDFAEFGPMFGGDDMGAGESDGAEGGTDTGSVALPDPGEPQIREEVIPAWSRVKWPFVIAGGATLATAGGLQLVAMSNSKAFYSLDNSELSSRSSVEDLRGRTNTMQTLALGAFAVGGGLMAVAVIPF